jgi:hypothetical protein
VQKRVGDPPMGRTRGDVGLDERFTNTKWLRLRDALALACRRLDSNNAKQEICDLVISRKLIMRGEKAGQYIFFDSQHYRSYVMPSNIDWRGGKFYQFDESYNSPNNLRVLNDIVFQNFVAARSLTNPKPPDRQMRNLSDLPDPGAAAPINFHGMTFGSKPVAISITMGCRRLPPS